MSGDFHLSLAPYCLPNRYFSLICFSFLKMFAFVRGFLVYFTNEAFINTSVIVVSRTLDDFLYLSLNNSCVLPYKPASRYSLLSRCLNASATWFKACHLEIRMQYGWYNPKTVITLFIKCSICCCRSEYSISVQLDRSFCFLMVSIRSTYRVKTSVTDALFELPQYKSTISPKMRGKEIYVFIVSWF